MTATVDPREALMWENDLLVTSDELKTYAANYPPMGVYIPRGRVKVPHLRSRRIQQISQSARGKPNSPNLLMIRPNGLSVTSNRLPSISVYASRDVTNYDVTMNMKRHHATSSRNFIEHRRSGVNPVSTKSASLDPMTSQYVQNTSDVINNKMAEYAKSIPHTQGKIQNPAQFPIMPPPYVDPGLEKVAHQGSNKTASKKQNMTSLMTHDMAYPMGHQYYQHLSAIAAMAWSDCNQATEKLRRIYEETAHLSRTYDPFGFFTGGMPGYNHHLLSSSPAMGNTATMFGAKDSMLPHADILAARYHQIADDHNKYLTHAMSQGKNRCVATPAQYPNFVSGSEALQCESKPGKARATLAAKNTQQYVLPREPLPGVTLFDAQYRGAATQPQATNEAALSAARQKRKLCDQSVMQNCATENRFAKYSRLDIPQPVGYGQNANYSSQSYGSMTSLFPEGVTCTSSRPPPYESIVQSSHLPADASIPDLFKMSAPADGANYQPIVNFADIINKDKINDASNTSSSLLENLKLCLPSVSCSPSQSYVNDLQRNVPFVVKH